MIPHPNIRRRFGTSDFSNFGLTEAKLESLLEKEVHCSWVITKRLHGRVAGILRRGSDAYSISDDKGNGITFKFTDIEEGIVAVWVQS